MKVNNAHLRIRMPGMWTPFRVLGASVIIRASLSILPASRSSAIDIDLCCELRKHAASSFEFCPEKIVSRSARKATRRTQANQQG